jgi:hypothetical protein
VTSTWLTLIDRGDFTNRCGHRRLPEMGRMLRWITILQLPLRLVPGQPFVLYLVAVVALAPLGRTARFLAVVEGSITCALSFEPVYSFRVTYTIDSLAIEVYAGWAALSVEAFCRVKPEASSARIQPQGSGDASCRRSGPTCIS